MKYLYLMTLLLFGLTPGLRAETALPDRRSSPVEITARSMTAEPAAGKAVFVGDVVARQVDVTLYCEQLTVYYRQVEGVQQVDRLEARKAVRMVQGDRVATGDEADYDQLRAVVVFRGSAKVHQGKNEVDGDEITIYLDENRSEVKSAGDGRVRAVFFPEATP